VTAVLRAGAAALAFVLAACSAVVDPDDVPLTCVVGGDPPDPCPVGLMCIEGRCRRPPTGCVAAEERCDGSDNDCDGNVDEGHDRDEDGVPWCGDLLDPATQDCDDSDIAVHPAFPRSEINAGIEICNGTDDDCDGSVDEGVECAAGQECLDRMCVTPDCTREGYLCAEGMRCDTTVSPATCVAGECTATSCPPGEICDPVTHSCVMRRPNGEACSTDAECRSESCVPAAALGVTGGPSQICASACCGDSDCGDADLCWTPGTGARGCVPAALLGRMRGDAGAGASCGLSTECQSGVCASNQCLSGCANDLQCPGQACTVFGPFDRTDRTGMYMLACGDAPGSGRTWDFCSDNTECRSGICLGSIFGGTCMDACASSADCESFLGEETYCGYVRIDAGGRNDYMQSCVNKTRSGAGRTGAACTGGDQCFDNTCIAGRCGDTCCSTALCPAGTQCEPTAAGSRWEMHCQE
jgi:hypothetical protein